MKDYEATAWEFLRKNSLVPKNPGRQKIIIIKRIGALISGLISKQKWLPGFLNDAHSNSGDMLDRDPLVLGSLWPKTVL